jgi:hypothetical protein
VEMMDWWGYGVLGLGFLVIYVDEIKLITYFSPYRSFFIKIIIIWISILSLITFSQLLLLV